MSRRLGHFSCLCSCLLTAGFLSTRASAQPVQQERVVLHEMFTATWCVFCPSVRATQSLMIAQDPEHIAVMQVHGDDSWSFPWGSSRNTFYGVTGYPTTVQDGILRRIGAFGQATYLNDFAARKAVPTDVSINLGGQQISGMTYEFVVVVGVIPSGTAKTMLLHLVQVLDDYPHDPQFPQYAGNERNCFIQAAPTQSITLNPGESQTFTHNFTFAGDSAANLPNIRVIAWVQKNGAFPQNSEVYQAAIQAYPFFADCNGNTLPDTQELQNCPLGDPSCADCDNNDRLDSCDINGCGPTQLDCKDCNGNQIPDGCEFDQLDDCDGSGFADACEIAAGLTPDCNGNGLPDSCDLAAFTSLDCNHNLSPDECDLAACSGQSWCEDCNNNGKLDECDLIADFEQMSPQKMPLGTGFVQTHTFEQVNQAVETVTFTFTAKGDLSASNEVVAASANGVSLGTLYSEPTFVDCSDGQVDTITMTAADFNNLRALGVNNSIEVVMTPAATVNPTPPSCPVGTYIRVQLAYVGLGISADLNGNGVPDECDAPAGCPGDLNCDGTRNFGDIDPFVLALQGEAAYSAQFPTCQWLNGDTNGDNTVNFGDIDPFVSLLGAGACP